MKRGSETLAVHMGLDHSNGPLQMHLIGLYETGRVRGMLEDLPNSGHDVSVHESIHKPCHV